MYCILDLEVQNIPYKGQTASPFCPENYIVLVGYAKDNGPVKGKRFANREESRQDDWIDDALEGTKVLVAHNATFEIHWLLSEYYDKFTTWLKNGGRIFCTQYAEYLLSHQTELYPALDTVAPKYGGTHKIDEVKLLWEQGVLTSDIEPGLLGKYLLGEGGDIENTRKVFCAQFQALKEQGMLRGFWERCDALLFNAFCTFHGMHIDTEVAYKNLKEQEQRISELTAEIKSYLPKDLPEDLDFKFSSDYHMSAFIFGGSIQYNTKGPYDPPKWIKDDFYKDKQGRRIPVSNYPTTEPFEPIVYTSGKNKGLPKVFREDTDVPKLKIVQALYKFPGLIDLNTLPESIKSQYLDKRGAFQGKRNLIDGTPVYSTGKDSLEAIKHYVPFAEKLLELGQLEKDTGTYYLRNEYNPDGSIKKTSGMLQFVEDSGIIHHQLNNCATKTGRLSSSNPNLQNLPRDGTSKVKQMLDSRFKDGYVVEVDYTALEVVTQASASGDIQLRQNLITGVDMHSFRLAGALHEPYEEVLARVKDETHPDHQKYKEMRTAIKPKAFAAQYGASAEGIAFATGCTVQEAQEFLDTEARLFPESYKFKQEIRAEVERTGAMAGNRFREVLPDGSWTTFTRGFYTAPGGTRYSFRTKERWDKELKQTVMDYKDTEIANYPIQGEGAFIVQCACARVIRYLLKNNFFDGKVLCINTVHDAIYLDCATEDLAKQAGAEVAKIMAETPKAMTEIMPNYREWDYHEIPFPAVPEYGHNLFDKVHV